MSRPGALWAVVVLGLAGVAWAQPAAGGAAGQAGAEAKERPAPAAADAASEPVVTRHTLAVGGRELAYEAVTGRLTMPDEAGKPQAHVFFVAYHLALGEGERASDRPVTFVFNGGPGAASVWLHLGVAGPKVIELRGDGSPLPPPARLVDNPDTWLAATDLVFIDPVGTGFSRAAEGVDAKRFYGVAEDVAAVGEFIRLYLGRYARWGSPKFLAGESYGTTRAAALADHLLDAQGVALNGVALISTVLDFGTLRFGGGNTLPYALFLPTYTAAAHHHGELTEELASRELGELLGEVERWAMTRYATALTLGDALPLDQRREVAETLARYTGLPLELVERAGLRVSPEVFRKELLIDRGLLLGRFDARMTGVVLEPVAAYAEYDPSLSSFLPIYATAFNAYVREELGYASDLKYEVLTDRVWPWDFGPAGQGPLDVTERLRAAMAKQPAMRVLVASGWFDLATPYLATDYTVDHLDLGEELRANLRQTYYPAGHMMYHERESLARLSADVAGLIRDAAGGGGVGGGAGDSRTLSPATGAGPDGR